jgi:8-oxo-dGTP pyrophosphatase MutT (NUDIX family)
LGSHDQPEMLATRGRSAGLLNAMPYGHVWRVHHKQPRTLKTAELAGASPAQLASLLEHPNGWVRETALRLLVEEHGVTVAPHLTDLLYSSRLAPARVAALWGLHRLGALTTEIWTNAITDNHSAVQKTAWLAFAESPEPVTRDIEKIVEKQFKDAEERVRIAMLMAVSKGPLTDDGRKAVAKLFPDVKDIWSKSVLLTIARETPLNALKIAFASDKSEHFSELAVLLVKQLARQPSGFEDVQKLISKSDTEKTEKLTAAVKAVLADPKPSPK